MVAKPLRERPEDILVLAEAFLEEIGQAVGRPAAGISQAGRERLLAHSWPGNVRELRNAVERAVILCRGGLIAPEHLPVTSASPLPASPTSGATPPPSAEPQSLDAIERQALVEALARVRDNKSRATRELGVSRGQLYSLLRRHGLTDAKR